MFGISEKIVGKTGSLLAKYTAHKMKFSIKISSVNVTKSPFPSDLVTFTEEILNVKLHVLFKIVSRKGSHCSYDALAALTFKRFMKFSQKI